VLDRLQPRSWPGRKKCLRHVDRAQIIVNEKTGMLPMHTRTRWKKDGSRWDLKGTVYCHEYMEIGINTEMRWISGDALI